MDYSQFGLRRRPFRPTPDTDAYYPSTSHETALDLLRRALEDDEGVMLLTSDTGLGKTLTARRLLEGLEETTRCVLLTNGHFATKGDLIQAILFDLGLPYQNLTEQSARLAMTDSCLEQYRSGGKTIVVVDEAHLLTVEILEELRLMSNLEGNDGKAVQIILVAMPEIEKTLEAAPLRLFRQRLVTRTNLEPLSIEESADYLRHHIRAAGGEPKKIFGPDVLDIVAHASNGSPRVLNRVAHLAFMLAQESGSTLVDAEAAVEAVTQLGLDPVAEAEAHAEDLGPIRLKPPSNAISIAAEPMQVQRPTIPFPPVILPIDEGPPTFVYGDDKPPQETWPSPNDRVG